MSRRASNTEKGEADGGTVHPDDHVVRKASIAVDNFADLSADAREATIREHQMSFRQAFKVYPKAVGWSILLSTTIIMEGYDIVLLNSFYALPQFNQKYGVEQNGTYVVPAPWKSGLSNASLCGEIIGLFLNGIISERYGYRKTLIGSLSAVCCFIFIPFFAPNIQVLLVGEILCGICWGFFQVLAVSYASEVCPVALRAYLCTYVNMCWVIGQLIGTGVLRAVLDRTDEWAYRIPFAIQWIWPVPLIIGCVFAPESPWWLVRKDRVADAKRALTRLTSASYDEFDVDKYVAMISHTNELEKHISAGTAYLDCFKGVDLRRTEIACACWTIQSICGSSFMSYSTYFYTQAGLAEKDSFDMSLAQYALGMIGTFGSWFLMSRAGRRTLYLYGSSLLCGLLLIIGFASISTTSGAKWAEGSMLLIFTFVYDLTVGPVCYSLITEMSSTRLKPKTVVLARNAYNISMIVANVLTTYQLTPRPSGWGWSARSAFFWAGSCALCVAWIFFRLPEPKGRTYAEMDVLFERGIDARKFRETKLDIFRSDNLAPIKESKLDEKVG